VQIVLLKKISLLLISLLWLINPITSQKSLFPPPDWPLPLHSSVSQAYFSTLPKITSDTVSFPLRNVIIASFLSASFLCILLFLPTLLTSSLLPYHIALFLNTWIFHTRASRVSQSPPITHRTINDIFIYFWINCSIRYALARIL